MSTDLMQKNIIENNEMIFYKEGGKIMSGGFEVNSSLLSGGIPVATIQNDKNAKGGSGKKVSDLFNHLVVPVGLYYEGLSGGKKSHYNYDTPDTEEREEISDDIYEQLLQHHLEKNNKQQQVNPRKTRKKYNPIKPNKNTRRFHKKK